MGESDDDAEIINVVGVDRCISDVAGEDITSETASDDGNLSACQPRPSRSKDANAVGERVVMSDDDGEAVYKKFKDRKATEKRRAAASTRKARALAAKGTGVGKRKAKAKAKVTRLTKTKVYDDDSDDALMEDTLPGYLQNRRKEFEANREYMKEAGLRVPPDYDDIDFSDDDKLADLKEKPDFPSEPPAAYKDITLPYSLGLIPAPIVQWLRDYQVQGVAFLHELFAYQKGGILGDDMGLGKTVQVIAFLTTAFGKTGDERDAKRMRKMRRARDGRWYPRVLVVCPGTLIENWKSEFQRWGWWQVDVFHADAKEAVLQAAKAGRLEVMITTYATYRLNKDTINMVEWDCVIADECHIIKERHSGVTKAMNEINALCRIGLTGTAIQNKYEELWTLLNWTNPGRFGPISTWKASISAPLKVGQSHDATVYQLSLARTTAKKLVENLLPEFFLRRMKTLIAHQLPKKSDKVVFCPLTNTQRGAYELFVDSDIVQYIKTSGDPCDCGSKKKRGWCCYVFLPSSEKRWQEFVFPAISNLQKLSNHLAMLIPQGSDIPEKQAKDLEMLQIVLPDQWRELYRDRDSILNFSNPEFCGKWKILKRLLKFWHSNGDKVLVFSHSVRLLKMLQMLFKHTSYNVSYLDGAMSYEDRSKTVDDFNDDPDQFVFLISTKAGGTGLNITSANKVVIVDPNWNPSYDLQAQDRAYRIGQIRDVEVFRLVSAGTIEEIVYARQIYKQQQANIGYNASTERRYFKGVQEKKDQKGEIFGLDNLFSYQGGSVVLRNIVNKTNVAESKAGVDVIQVDMDQAAGDVEDPLNDEEEDKAMSQLATLVMKGETSVARESPSKKTDAVQAILAGAGVEYTHENSEVIGSSKIEAHLSKRAENAGSDLKLGDKKVFSRNQDDAQDEANLKHGNGHAKLLYHPPQDVIKRQFCTMAKTFGFENATEFALVVEGWTQEQRRSCLDKFYRIRRERLLKLEKGQEAMGERTRERTTEEIDLDEY